MLSNNALCLCSMPSPVHVTIFSTGGKFRPVSNFTKLHALTLAARSLCALDSTYYLYLENKLYSLPLAAPRVNHLVEHICTYTPNIGGKIYGQFK